MYRPVLLILLCYLTTAQIFGSESLKYIKNNGQWDDHILFRTDLVGGHLFLEQNKLSFTFFDYEKLHQLHHLEVDHFESFVPENHFIDAYAYNISFLNNNPNASIKPINKHKEYHNYFLGNDISKWASKVPLFSGVNYQQLYLGIDMNIYSQENHLKYDFIVSPNADPSLIEIQYSDLLHINIIDKALHIDLGFNTIVEQKPYAYQVVEGVIIEVKCNYVLTDNILSYEFPEGYNESLELIIDPVLIASTLSGSSVTNYGHSATFDDNGHIYTGARNFGVGYPSTVGSYQINYGGGSTDIAISKLNPDGSILLWASYIGGNSAEYPHSMYVQNNELYVLGSTSSDNFPTTLGAFDNSLGGSGDIVVSHLSEDGSIMIGSTYVGGSNADGTNNIFTNYADTYRGEIIVDNAGNAYIASFSNSTDFPTTPGAYQQNLSDDQDGVILKLNPDMSNLLWATFLGGSGSDAAYGLRLDGNNDLYVTGASSNNDFPTTTGSYQENYLSGDKDAFIAKLENNGSILAYSTLYGTDQKDQSFFIDLDTDGAVYIFGQTDGTIPISEGCYGNEDSKQFIAKFSEDLSNLEWQTVVGASGSAFGYGLVPIAFMVDVCDHIYISGHGASPGFFTSEDAIFNTGGFYQMVLEADASAVNYATYYTGDHVDGGTSRFDPSGKIYQAVCSGGGFNTTANAYATTQSSSWDIGVFKINLNTSVVSAQATISPSNSGCTPFDVNFNNFSTEGEYVWSFGDGSTSTLYSPSHTFESAGNFMVELVVTDNESCNFSDTTLIPIFVSNSEGVYNYSIDNACLGSPIQFTAVGATSNDTILWDLGDGTITESLNPLHNYDDAGSYNISLTVNSVCNSISVFEDVIVVDSIPNLQLGGDIEICSNETITINAVSDADNLIWSTDETSSSITVNSGGVYTIQALNGDCIIEDEITVSEDPFTFSLPNDIILCYDEPTTSIDAGPEAISYNWSNGDTTQTILVSEGNYSVTVLSENNCEYIDDISIYLQSFDMEIGSSSEEECVPATISFTDLSTISYGNINTWDWNFAIQTNSTSNPNIDYNSVGVYDVELTVTSDLGCTDQIILNNYIQINPNPVASFSYDTHIEDCEVLVNFFDESEDVTHRSWRFSNGSEQIINNPTEYFNYNTLEHAELVVENEFLCSDSTSQEFEIPRMKPLFMPNVFTPNGDSDNDVFKPVSSCITDLDLFIYDRWGKLLFTSKHIDYGWNGTYKGALMNNDSYIWRILYEYEGEQVIDEGYVILLD